MPSILDHFPEPEIRSSQRELLLEIEANWSSYDVFVLICPTAFGKTAIEVCIARWVASMRKSATLLYPTNILVDQTCGRYPYLTRMSKKAAYHCADFDRDCETTHTKCERYCHGCPYVEAKKAAKQAKIKVMNYHTYWAHKLYSDVLICDENHSIVDLLGSSQEGIKLWHSKYKFPTTFKTTADVLVWAQEYLSRYTNQQLADAVKDMIRIKDSSIVQYNRSMYRGQEQIVLQITPTSARGVPPWLWPSSKVEKIVMLSATTGEQDIYEMALERRRVKYIEVDSPIPVANRQVIFTPVANMAHRYVDTALPHMAKQLLETVETNPGYKGLVHAPYSIALKLKEMVDHPRILWHTKENKSEVLVRFKESDPAEGLVLVASGLYEGVDLPYDAARWQAILKVPYLSLADPRIKYKCDNDPRWYQWETIKRVLQAAGRIVRAPDDFGKTYIWDTNFERLYHSNQGLFPDYFRRALRFN